MRRRREGSTAALAWLVAAAGLGRWLWGLGGGALGAPPLGRPGRWAAWVEVVGPVHAVFALLRLGCLVAVGYLMAALVVGLAAHLSGARLLLRASDAISVALVRRLLHGAVGFGVTTGALAAGAGSMVPVAVGAATVDARPGAPPTMRPFVPTADAADRPPIEVLEPRTPTMHPVEPALPAMRAAEPGLPTILPVEPRLPTMRPVEPEPPTMRPAGAEPTSVAGTEAPPPSTPVAVEPAEPPAPTVEAAASAALPPPSSVVLGPGDHLWAVAERHLADHLDRAPGDGEVTEHWRRLIALNRADLADPANPDLVFAGQLIRLPPL